jgi:hypothetical protein
MEQPKKTKRIIIFCEPCAFKTIIEKEETVNDFVEIKTSPIPGGIPELDPKTGKTWDCDATLIADKLKLTGYWKTTIFGRTEIWTRTN